MNLTRRQFLRSGMAAVNKGPSGIMGTIIDQTPGLALSGVSLSDDLRKVFVLQGEVKQLSHIALWHIFGEGHSHLPDIPSLIQNQPLGKHIAKTQVATRYNALVGQVLSLSERGPHIRETLFNKLDSFAKIHLFDSVFRDAETHDQRSQILKELLSGDRGVEMGLYFDLDIGVDHEVDMAGGYLAKWLLNAESHVFENFLDVFRQEEFQSQAVNLSDFFQEFFWVSDPTPNEKTPMFVSRLSRVFSVMSKENQIGTLKHIIHESCSAQTITVMNKELGIKGIFFDALQKLTELDEEYSPKLTSLLQFEDFSKVAAECRRQLDERIGLLFSGAPLSLGVSSGTVNLDLADTYILPFAPTVTEDLIQVDTGPNDPLEQESSI